MIGTVGGRAGPITSATNERAFGVHNDVRRWRSPRRVTRWCPGRGGVLAWKSPTSGFAQQFVSPSVSGDASLGVGANAGARPRGRTVCTSEVW